MRQRRNKGRHHGRGRGEPACEIVAPVGAGCAAAVCLEAQRSVDDSGDGPSTIVTPMTATAARTSRDGRHLRRCTPPCSQRRHRVSRMPYTSARTPLLGGEASAMLIQPCAVRASRPAAAGTTAGSPSLHRRFRHASRAPPARHASRRPRSGRVAPTRRGQPSPGAGAVEWGRACGTGAAPAAARGARAARGGRGRRTARSFRQPPWLPKCRERAFQGWRFSSFSPRASGEPSLLEPQQTLRFVARAKWNFAQLQNQPVQTLYWLVNQFGNTDPARGTI